MLGRELGHPGERARAPRAPLPRPQHGEGRRRDGHLGRSPPRSPASRSRASSAAPGPRSPPASRSASSRTRRRSSGRRALRSAEGYRKVKIKIEPGRDVAFVARRPRRARPGRPADGRRQQRLHARRTPTRLLELDALGLMMIEQPLAWDDLAAPRRAAAAACARRSASTSPSPALERAQDMVALGSGRIINIKPGRVGGFASIARDPRLLPRSTGIPVWCGGMLESGVGRAYNVALASLPNFTPAGRREPERAATGTQDVVTPEWTMDDGIVRRAPRPPGHRRRRRRALASTALTVRSRGAAVRRERPRASCLHRHGR